MKKTVMSLVMIAVSIVVGGGYFYQESTKMVKPMSGIKITDGQDFYQDKSLEVSVDFDLIEFLRSDHTKPYFKMGWSFGEQDGDDYFYPSFQWNSYARRQVNYEWFPAVYTKQSKTMTHKGIDDIFASFDGYCNSDWSRIVFDPASEISKKDWDLDIGFGKIHDDVGMYKSSGDSVMFIGLNFNSYDRRNLDQSVFLHGYKKWYGVPEEVNFFELQDSMESLFEVLDGEREWHEIGFDVIY